MTGERFRALWAALRDPRDLTARAVRATPHSVDFSFHRPRAFGASRDLFMAEICLGIVTVGVSRHVVPDVLRQYAKVLRDVAKVD